MEEEKLIDTIEDSELVLIDQEKQSAYNFRERRHSDWKENYTLSRDKVITNRLLQKQTINIPLMKYGLATVLKDIDEPAVTNFVNLSNNEEKEIFYNEGWKDCQKKNKARIKDRVFKKNLCLYGRAFRKLNIVKGKVVWQIVLAEDMLVDRFIDSTDIDSARILIQTNIFRTLTSILINDTYDQEGRDKLSDYHSVQNRTAESGTNTNRYRSQIDKMKDMGVTDTREPVVGATYIELNEVYRVEYDEKLKEEIIFLYIVADTGDGYVKLLRKPLEEVLGETNSNAWREHFPYTSAAADPESDDFWSDAPADTLRQPNKALNSFIGSLVENRILRNFNMHYYNSSNASFIPQVFTPSPWAWFPMPGNPNELVKDVVVGDLSESLDEMQFMIGIAEKAVAATSAQTGELPAQNVTLGQTQLALANAKERTKTMLIPIEQEYVDFAEKYIWLVEAAGHLLDDIKVSRKGKEGRQVYTKIIKSADYADDAGYMAEVKMKEDLQAMEVSTIQKLQIAREAMPGNPPLELAYKKRLVDFADLKSEEVKEILDYEKSRIDNAQNGMLPLNAPADVNVEQPQGGNIMPVA